MSAVDEAAPPRQPGVQRRTRKNRRYNWTRLKAEYVEGIISDTGQVRFPTFDEISQRNNALSQNVRNRAAREGWTDQRAMFQRRIEAQRQNERSTEIAALATDLDVNALRIARSGLSLTAARLQELGSQAQRRQDHLRQTQGADAAGAPAAPDSDEVRILARAATDWYDLGQKALGQVPVQRFELDVDVDVALADDERAARILEILSEAGVLDAGGTEGALDVAGTERSALAAGVDTTHEPVHPEDADDARQPEREATDVPAARPA